MPYPDDDKAKAALALQRNAQERAFPTAVVTELAKAVELYLAAGALYGIIFYLFGQIVDGDLFDKVVAAAGLLFLIPMTVFFQSNLVIFTALKIDEVHFKYLRKILDTKSEKEFRRRAWISYFVRVATLSFWGISYLTIIILIARIAFPAGAGSPPT